MIINGTLPGRVVKLTRVENQKRDGTRSEVDVVFDIQRGDMPTIFEDTIDQLAFGGVVAVVNDDGEEDVFCLQDRVKPGRRVVFDTLDIDWDGRRFAAQPVLRWCAPLGGGIAATFCFRFELDGDDAKHVFDDVGGSVRIGFSPVQQQLQLQPRRDAEVIDLNATAAAVVRHVQESTPDTRPAS